MAIETLEEFLSNIFYAYRGPLIKEINDPKNTDSYAYNEGGLFAEKLTFLAAVCNTAIFLRHKKIIEETISLFTESDVLRDLGHQFSLLEFCEAVVNALKTTDDNTNKNLTTRSPLLKDLLDTPRRGELIKKHRAFQTAIEVLFEVIRNYCTQSTRGYNLPVEISIFFEMFTRLVPIQLTIGQVIRSYLANIPGFDDIIQTIPTTDTQRITNFVLYFALPAFGGLLGAGIYTCKSRQIRNFFAPQPQYPFRTAYFLEASKSVLPGGALLPSDNRTSRENNADQQQVVVPLVKEIFRRKKIAARANFISFGLIVMLAVIWFVLSDQWIKNNISFTRPENNKYTPFFFGLVILLATLVKKGVIPVNPLPLLGHRRPMARSAESMV